MKSDIIMSYGNIKKQRGATLIELMLTLSLMSIITVSMFAARSSDMDVVMAKSIGAHLLQYNNAVHSFIADNPNRSYPLSESGSAWLKHTSCFGGVSPVSYLPCEFPDFDTDGAVKLGNILTSTEIEEKTDGGSTFIEATTTTSPIRHNQVQRADLAGIAALVAESSGLAPGSPPLLMTNATFRSNPNDATIKMVASNAKSNDAWLRTDGSNTMKGVIEFESSLAAQNREITGVSTVRGEGTEILSVRSSNNNSSIAVEPSKAVTRSGSSLFEITPTRSIVKVGNASIKTGSGSVISESGSSSSEVNSSSVINKVGDIASTEINSESTVSQVGTSAVSVRTGHAATKGDHQIRGIANIGSDDDVDFDAIRASGVSTNINGTALISGTIVMDGDIKAQGTMDIATLGARTFASHGGGYLTPSDRSQLHSVSVRGGLYLIGESVKNDSCSSNKLIGTTLGGEIVTCRNYIWRQVRYE